MFVSTIEFVDNVPEDFKDHDNQPNPRIVRFNMSIKVAFLDRDGTINVDYGYIHMIHQWTFTEGAINGLRLLQNSGFALAVVTNQSAVAAGLYSEHDIEELHSYVQAELRRSMTHLDAIAFCPHGANAGCKCRKPNTNLVYKIAEQLGETIDFENSWTIGDKVSDMLFGESLGTRNALIRSTNWRMSDLGRPPNIIVGSLYEAATRICGGNY